MDPADAFQIKNYHLGIWVEPELYGRMYLATLEILLM